MSFHRRAILLVIPELSLGGAARVVRDHAAAFASRFNVHEAVFNSTAAVDYQGGEIHSLDVKGGGSLVSRFMHLCRRIRRLSSLKRGLRPAFSISHLEGAHYVDVLSRRSEKIILCVHSSIIHNNEISGPFGALRKRVLIPASYNRADAIVTVSSHLDSELVGLGVKASLIRSIPNFFDVEDIRSKSLAKLDEREASLIGKHSLRLLVPARLHHQKNLIRLIDVVSKLRAELPVKLIFVGDGPERDRLIGHARSRYPTFDVWGRRAVPDPTFVFLGPKPNPFPYFRHADLMICSSLIEGFPMSVGEAMVCGLPVASADCPGGVRELLAPSTRRPKTGVSQLEIGDLGALLPMLDGRRGATEAWVTGLKRLLNSPNVRAELSANGQAAIEGFTREAILPRWFALFDELLEASPSAEYPQ